MIYAAWQSLLNADFIRRQYPDWAGPELDHAALCDLFLQHGLPDLAPLSAGLEFDAKYFVETHPEWEGVGAVDCYRAWLLDHSSEPPSEKAHLEKLWVPDAHFPIAFPWRFYAELRPSAGANKWVALEDFLDTGFRDVGERLPYGEGAQGFLVDLARRYSRFHDTVALKAFNLAEGYGALTPDAKQHHADAYLRLGFAAPARAIYKTLIDQGEAAPWTVRNYYLASASMGRRAEAIGPVLKTAPILRTDEVWRKTAWDMIDGLFDDALQAARSHYLDDERVKGDRRVTSAVDQINGILQALASSSPVPQSSGDRVVMFAAGCDLHLTHTRISQRKALFAALGRPFTIFTDDWSQFEEALQDACAVIFLEAAARPKALELLQSVRRYNLPIFYEAYTPVFDPTCSPPPLERFAGYLTTSQHNNLKIDACLHQAFARLCDFGLSPTASIAQRLEPLVGAHRGWLLPDVALFDSKRLSNAPSPDGSAAITILIESPRYLYLSPTDRRVGEAIFAALSFDNTLQFVASGYIQLDAGYDVFDDRITELGAIMKPGEHVASLSGRIVNIAITVDPGDDATSSASWLAAACCGVPSVIDAAGAAAAALSDDNDAAVVTSPEQWRDRLLQVIARPEFAAKLGERAYQRAQTERSLDLVAPLLTQAIDQLEERPSGPFPSVKSLLWRTKAS